MGNQIKVLVKCPNCNQSLMNSRVQIDDLPSIDLQSKVGNMKGHVYLSQIYGSYNKVFEQVEDIANSIAEFSCPHCNSSFPELQICDCEAPMIGMDLKGGGIIKICTRNGCKHHALEFVDVNDAFALFRSQNESGLA